jgi:hypothetical protein
MSNEDSMRILRGLSSKTLPCGCLAGVYETYDGVVVEIVDAKGTRCDDSSHRDGKIIPAPSESSSSAQPKATPPQAHRFRRLD